MNVNHILTFVRVQSRERISSRLKSHNNRELLPEGDDAVVEAKLDTQRIEICIAELLDSGDGLASSSRRSDFESRAPNMATSKAAGAANMFVMA